MNNAATIAVVTINWNGWQFTLNCLEALRTSVGEEIEWHAYVVDNASTDDSLARLADLGEQATLIRSPINGGWTGGNNLGVQHALRAGHEFIFLLNNDARVDKEALQRLLSAFKDRASEVPILGCLQRSDDGEDLTFICIGIDPGTGLLIDRAGESAELLKQPLIATAVVNGAALFAHRSVFEQIGPFDDRFYLNFDESDWCRRAHAAGHALYTVREAIVFHSGNKSIGGHQSPLQQYFLFRNRLLFSEKHGTFVQRLRVFRRCVSYIRDLTGRANFATFLRQVVFPSPTVRAAEAGLRDYLLRRFGNCPDAIRKLKRSA